VKVAVVRRVLTTILDGVNRFCAYLAEGLRRLGHEVFIASWGFYGVDIQVVRGGSRGLTGRSRYTPSRRS